MSGFLRVGTDGEIEVQHNIDSDTVTTGKLDLHKTKNSDNPTGGGTHFTSGRNWIRGVTEVQDVTTFKDRVHVDKQLSAGGTQLNAAGKNKISGDTVIEGGLRVTGNVQNDQMTHFWNMTTAAKNHAQRIEQRLNTCPPMHDNTHLARARTVTEMRVGDAAQCQRACPGTHFQYEHRSHKCWCSVPNVWNHGVTSDHRWGFVSGETCLSGILKSR